MPPAASHWDLFCKVVDNFGDIGVCWRLACQLACAHGLDVRLWVDQPAALAPLCPAAIPDGPPHHGVRLRHWPSPWAGDFEPGAVVIEAFACDLPAAVVAGMARSSQPPVWINLDYLSAEAWVRGCHGLASPHPQLALNKYFFFPGFDSGTGGLLREADALAAAPFSAQEFPALHTENGAEAPFLASLFCYDSAPVGKLLKAWANDSCPIRCLVPPGKPLAAVRQHLQGSGPWQIGALEVLPIPFLPQRDYDRLLKSCALNFVRGEDSLVRGLWAGQPLVWQIYPQDDAAHQVKLAAFLERLLTGMPPAEANAVHHFFDAWNHGRDSVGQNTTRHWPAFRAALPAYTQRLRQWREQLASQTDLAARLVSFCREKL